VTVVTYSVAGEVRGATVNAFTAVSLDPPLVMIALGRNSRACAGLDGVPFAVNVLAADQIDVALQFAGRPRPGARIGWRPRAVADPADVLAATDDLAPIDGAVQADDRDAAELTQDGPAADAPSLLGAVAVFHCRPWRRYDGGDHVLHVGRVRAAETHPGEPLVFSDGGFTMTGLPLFDGPLVSDFGAAPLPSWSAAVRRLQQRAEAV
jgi:flavin reductase (DIM6/NTAB) family NADH-FMN oxidoreductase RutF